MSSTAPTESFAPGAHQADPRRWISLAVVLCASFMVLLDISIVNVAIPTIQGNLKVSYAEIQWVLAGYQLAYGVLLITGGRLGDIAGRKRMFIIGVSGFTLASALCGLAPSGGLWGLSAGGFLIAARVLQGGFAAMMYPQVFSVIQVAFPPRERAKAFGVTGGVIGVASITGPLAGGLLVKLGIFDGWRPIFLVNLPIGLGAVIAAVIFLHESRAADAPRADIGGVVLSSLALLSLLYPIVEGRDAGWPWWIFALMGLSVLLLAAFWRFERRRAQGRGSPLIEPQLFRDRTFVIGVLIAALFFAGVPAFFFTFSLYLQFGLAFSALQAGAITVPFAVCSAVASGISIRLVPRFGKRLLQAGMATLVLGTVLVGVTVYVAGASLQAWTMAPALAISGLGLGLTVAPLLNVILAGVNRAVAGSASGVLTTMQQLGGAIGVAVIGVIFFGLLANHADVLAQQGQPALTAQLTNAGVPAAISQGRIVPGFAACVHDRATENDPTVVPASCTTAQTQANLDPQVGAILARAGVNLNSNNFAHAFWLSLGFEVSVWTLTLLLVGRLPAVARVT